MIRLNAYNEYSRNFRSISRVTRIVYRGLRYQQNWTVLGATGSGVRIPVSCGMRTKLTLV